MYYYPIKNIQRLIEDIKKDREQKVSRNGKLGYKDLMNFNKATKSDSNGFWSKAYLIEKEEN